MDGNVDHRNRDCDRSRDSSEDEDDVPPLVSVEEATVLCQNGLGFLKLAGSPAVNGQKETDVSSLIDDCPDPAIRFVSYESELQMPAIMGLIQKDLSEPYSIYTYRYFIHNWPKLCFLAMDGSRCIGAIVCKLDLHKHYVSRGYIAMLVNRELQQISYFHFLQYEPFVFFSDRRQRLQEETHRNNVGPQSNTGHDCRQRRRNCSRNGDNQQASTQVV